LTRHADYNWTDEAQRPATLRSSAKVLTQVVDEPAPQRDEEPYAYGVPPSRVTGAELAERHPQVVFVVSGCDRRGSI
jgi:hypothetical protein